MKLTLAVIIIAIPFSFSSCNAVNKESNQTNPGLSKITSDVCCGFTLVPESLSEFGSDSFYTLKILTDSINEHAQCINILMLDRNSRNNYRIDFVYQGKGLMQTSKLAAINGATAAINGSFFNMDNGGSVSYFERNDSIINRKISTECKWAVPDSLANGALILTKNQNLIIEHANTEQFYEASGEETFVIITGPLLVSNSKAQQLPQMNFSTNRHPRTCVGITKKSIIFMVVDGRSGQAAGMSLLELQEYLLNLGCIDAINLDGGGSSTLWTKDKGIVNTPSDKTGERPVANALIIRGK